MLGLMNLNDKSVKSLGKPIILEIELRYLIYYCTLQ